MQYVSKLNASLHQSFEDLEKETFPENGLAVACLEVCMLKKARIVLKENRRRLNEGGFDPDYLKGQDLFEEDFYLGNSDKLIYTIKQFHYEASEPNLYKYSNPLVMSKLDTMVSKN